MPRRLFDLFNDKTKAREDLVAAEPQTLESLSNVDEEQELIVSKLAKLESVEPLVDYSDFANHVFFNSALDYFNITGEKIVNDYPIDGTIDDIESFTNDLDGYQRHVLNEWPSRTGHLRFDTSVSASYITVDDVGMDREADTYRAGILSPNTGSISVEMWLDAKTALTGPDDVMVLIQKASGSDGYTLYLTGSEVRFTVTSASVTEEVSAPMSYGIDTYVAGVMDRTAHTGTLSIMTGSSTSFPVVVNTSSLGIHGPIDLGGTQLLVCSGTLVGKTTRFFTGSIDDVRVWKKPRALPDVSSSFNVKLHAQKNLVALYRFNESGSAHTSDENEIVRDSSGMKLHGRVTGYYFDMRGSGSMLLGESPDPILNIDTTDVSAYITKQQSSGSDYDRFNQNKLTDMVPEAFLRFDDEVNTNVLKNFLYVYARNFDAIKLRIDHLLSILTVGYGDYDQAPDEVLDVVASYFGWEFTGNFLNTDAFQYLLGRNVLGNLESNMSLDKKLFEIKNDFWRRLLANLMYIYKTKGTRESVEALMRAYGVGDNFVRIKEYGHTPDVGIITNRISTEKSVSALGFGSGTLSASVIANPIDENVTGSYTIESRIRFPLTSSTDITPTSTSGSLFFYGSSGNRVFRVRYEKDSLSSHTGTLSVVDDNLNTVLTMSDVGVFDNRWYNVSLKSDVVSSSLSLGVRRLDENEIDFSYTVSKDDHTSGLIYSGTIVQVGVGFVTGSFFNSEHWAQEFRVWNSALTNRELDDHTLNFQSYGRSDPAADVEPVVHWRLNEDVTASFDGEIFFDDVTPGNVNQGIGTGFDLGKNPFKKFLNDYNYIASLDFGWSEDKIRIFDTDELKSSDFTNDTKIFALEFNMIDALNEDIVQTMESLDHMNEVIGYPSNRYRVEYDDLRVLRHNYFRRLQGRLNFTVFADLLEFFDRSFIDMVARLVPARALFMGDEFVVESHMLERPKVTYERRKFQETSFEPEGRIEIWSRFGVNRDKSGRTLPLFPKGGGSAGS